MTTKLCMPQWGMGIAEGRIAKWLVAEGDVVVEGEPIVEVETAKAVAEVEAPASGILARILVPEEAIVSVRSVIAIIAEPGEVIDENE